MSPISRTVFSGGFLGASAVTTPIAQAFSRGQPVPLVTSVLVWLSWLLAPLAAEAIGFKVHGTCSHLDFSGCGIELGVSPAPARALLAVLAAMLVLLAALALLLRRWETGLHANPWSLAAVASLSLSRSLREPLVRAGEPAEQDLGDMFCHGSFRLETFDAADDGDEDDDDDIGADVSDRVARYEYGIVSVLGGCHGYSTNGDAYDATGHGNHHQGNRTTCSATSRAHTEDRRSPRHRHTPFLALTYTCQGIFAAVLLGLMALLVYYHLLREDNAFELFMDSQAFGVKFLFAALGTAISLFWTSFFQSVATITPFLHMAHHPRRAAQSILVTRPTNAFCGTVAAVRQRDALLLASALTAGLAELFLPVLLSNIPYTLTQTLASHTACTAAALAVLAAMVAVLAASMRYIRWPHMPVDPRTLAGAMYYVADSRQLLRDMRGRGMATKDRKSRDAELEALGGRYFYAQVEGSSGWPRMVVDAEDDCRCNRSEDKAV